MNTAPVPLVKTLSSIHFLALKFLIRTSYLGQSTYHQLYQLQSKPYREKRCYTDRSFLCTHNPLGPVVLRSGMKSWKGSSTSNTPYRADSVVLCLECGRGNRGAWSGGSSEVIPAAQWQSTQIFTSTCWSDFSSESEGRDIVTLTLERWLETGRVLGDFEESAHDSRWRKDP